VQRPVLEQSSPEEGWQEAAEEVLTKREYTKMIPRTFPSIFEDSKTKCVVFVLPSISGLQAWTDYIPVKGITTENTAVENTYANDGYIVMKTVDGTQKAWIDYIPVYEDASYTKPWSTDAGGYIPASGLFSIRGTLFGNDEPGAWYDPSDMTTLFQDAAGTTPVTAVEQPVGLMLDKSRGLVLGPELVPATYAGAVSGSWSIGATSITRNGSATGQASLSLGASPDTNKRYQLIFTVADLSGDTLGFRLGGGTAYNITTNGTYTFRIAPGGTSALTFIPWSGTAGQATITNISVRELPGNHAFQSVATTSRPVLSARYNLLTKTEQFDDTSTIGWTGNGSSISANQTIAPDGTLTADKLIEDSANSFKRRNANTSNRPSSAGSTTYTYSIYIKDDGEQWVALYLYDSGNSGPIFYANFDLTNLATGLTGRFQGTGTFVSAAITDAQSGWRRCSLTFTTGAGTGTLESSVFLLRSVGNVAPNTAFAPQTYTGDGTSGIYIWGAQLEQAT
jgi:hypothetical protein